MQVWNDTLDDPYVYDAASNFIGGVVSNTINPSTLAANQISDGLNIELDYLGNCSTRRGASAIGTAQNSSKIQGLFYYKTSAHEQILKANGTSLYTSSNATSWGTAVGTYTTSSASNNVNFAQLVNFAYTVDGVGEMGRWDGTAFSYASSWGTANPPPSGIKYIINHDQRIVGAGVGTASDTLFCSDIIDGTSYPVLSQIKVGASENDSITGILSWVSNTILVGKRRSLWSVSTVEGVGSDAIIQKLHGSIGVVANRTMCQVTDSDITNSDVFFLSSSGVHSVRSTIDSGQQGVGVPISLPIDNYIKRINWQYADTSCAIFHNNRYILAIPLDSATTPNYVFSYNLLTRSWSPPWTGWTPQVFEVINFSQQPKMIFGLANGNVWVWRDYVSSDNETAADYQDAGTDFSYNMLSKGFVFGEYLNPKFGDQVEIEFFQSDANVNIYAIADGSGDTLIAEAVQTAAGSGWTFPITFPFIMPSDGIVRWQGDLRQLNDFRQIQIKVSGTSGKMALRSIYLCANVNAIKRAV